MDQAVTMVCHCGILISRSNKSFMPTAATVAGGD